MNNEILARELVQRLNKLIESDGVREPLEAIINYRVSCGQDVADHPSIQVSSDSEEKYRVGLLGILNGIVGTQSSGRWDGWGYIAAVFDDDDGRLLRFEVLDDESRAIGAE